VPLGRILAGSLPQMHVSDRTLQQTQPTTLHATAPRVGIRRVGGSGRRPLRSAHAADSLPGIDGNALRARSGRLMARKRQSTGQTIGAIVAGFEQQVWRTTPPAHELVAKGKRLAAVPAEGGGTLTVGFADEAEAGTAGGVEPATLHLAAPGARAVVDLVHGGRLASLVVDGRELLVTEGVGRMAWGSFPMAPFAGRVRDGRFTFLGERYQLPIHLPPHAIHGTVLDRPWHQLGERSIGTGFGPDWPFAGRAIQRFELREGRFLFHLEVHADEPMPVSIGWHPWFRRQPHAVDPESAADHDAPSLVELDLDAASMYVRDAEGITTSDRVVPGPGPWDDCFTDLRRPPVLRWPGFLELTIESNCRDWVVYTVPTEALCVEPQTAPPDALNLHPAIVEPGRPFIAEMTWTWRSLAG
jgi:aldose 1-epimerase